MRTFNNNNNTNSSRERRGGFDETIVSSFNHWPPTNEEWPQTKQKKTRKSIKIVYPAGLVLVCTS
jgi:hypothetical protein